MEMSSDPEAQLELGVNHSLLSSQQKAWRASQCQPPPLIFHIKLILQAEQLFSLPGRV